TGAFYFSFENKEALFRAILEPLIEQFSNMTEALSRQEMERPETAEENDRKIMEFAYCHKKEILILMEHTQGSCYENFGEHVRSMMADFFRRHFAYNLGEQPNEDLIRILADMRIQSSLTILKGNYDMDYTLYLTDAIGCYADSGTEKLINKIKEDVHRK
ncbi:MAG: TetR/AcrR family transcriptional regulator, partial [Roseburia sp.]